MAAVQEHHACGRNTSTLKEWLKGAKLEEDPETGPNNVGAGKEWDALVRLVQAIWDKGC